jgi:D-serine deaminase-like pyridoxal phosphate-dependent protein
LDPLTDFLAKVRPPRTPALVVRRLTMERNLRKLQADCDAAGVRLRPHGKMAKCSKLAQMQLELGAVGLCCQTVGEAEAFADAGIIDLLVSAPVPPWGWPVLGRLVERGIRV